MRKLMLLVHSLFLIFCLVGAAADRVAADDLIVLPGRMKVKNECHCPIRPANCKCVIYITTIYELWGRSNDRGGLYEYLVGLDSFDGEDDEFLYFRGVIVEGTEPPVFDIRVRGDASIRISKKSIEEYLMLDD